MAKKKTGDESEDKKVRTVYLYEKKTGAYVGPYDATDGDPEGTFTEEKPPIIAADDKIACFRKGKWETVLANDLSQIAEALMKRDHLLAASDWTQVEDSQVDKTKWSEYRQSLRDLTKQEGFPAKVEWPKMPSTDPVEKKPAEPAK